MVQPSLTLRWLLTFTALTVAAGCSYLPSLDEVLPDRRTEYRKAESLPDLEVPPDLSTEAIGDKMPIPETRDGTATYSTYQERVAETTKERELVATENAAIKVLENEYVLAVGGAIAQVWPELEEFWAELGYGLEIDDEELGVMETEWRENAQTLTRDKFKIFAEPGTERGTTVLYVSHVAEELKPEGEGLVWKPMARDVDLERRLVDRIAESLGSGSEVARYSGDADDGSAVASGGAIRAEIVSAGGGKVYLNVEGDYDDVWRRTGEALAAASVEVDDSDLSRGLYTIRIETDEEVDGDGRGFFSRLKFWSDDDNETVDPSLYRLSLTNTGERTEIVVLNSIGEWSDRDEARELISVLYDHLSGRAS